MVNNRKKNKNRVYKGNTEQSNVYTTYRRAAGEQIIFQQDNMATHTPKCIKDYLISNHTRI